MRMRGDSIRVVHPLFQAEGDGSTPISSLQLIFDWMDVGKALELNKLWHSMLPALTNHFSCKAIGASYANTYYAVALWGPPISWNFNNKGYYELRRMAISSDAPKNTASRMLKIMRIMICKARPDVVRLISYQDTGVHRGTIYKASGWKPVGRRRGYKTTWSDYRKRADSIATGDKIRWEYDLPQKH